MCVGDFVGKISRLYRFQLPFTGRRAASRPRTGLKTSPKYSKFDSDNRFIGPRNILPSHPYQIQGYAKLPYGRGNAFKMAREHGSASSCSVYTQFQV